MYLFSATEWTTYDLLQTDVSFKYLDTLQMSVQSFRTAQCQRTTTAKMQANKRNLVTQC